MGTVDNRKMIEQVIANDGKFSDDPPIDFVVEYTNMAGNICWGVIYYNERRRLVDYMDLPKARVVFDRLLSVKRPLGK